MRLPSGTRRAPVRSCVDWTERQHHAAGAVPAALTTRLLEVGWLERVGSGRWPPARVAQALEARDRAACGPVAPPDGLYLAGVEYPDGMAGGDAVVSLGLDPTPFTLSGGRFPLVRE